MIDKWHMRNTIQHILNINHDTMIKQISLYLSWLLPGKYILPNRLWIIHKIRKYDINNFNDTMIWLLIWKCDAEYYNTLLETYKNIHWDHKFNKLLIELDIPTDIFNDDKDNIDMKINKIYFNNK